MKLTRWYRGDQKPLRVGVYQRKEYYGEIIYAYWDGRYWRVGFPSNENAYFFADSCRVSMHRDWSWRGVAK